MRDLDGDYRHDYPTVKEAGGLNVLASKLSAKGQVAIPKEVRDRLGVKAGDLVAYEVRGGVATVRRVEPFDAAFHAALFPTFGEWATPADDEAFSDL